MKKGLLFVSIGCDHAGFLLKEKVKMLFTDEKHFILNDCGTFSEESVDYPDFVHPVAKSVNKDESDLGILICGSGNGVCMTANKYPNVRAALCWTNELAELSRAHNDANILCLPARFVSEELAIEMINTFLNTEFESGRHLKRVMKINNIL
ncbi:MAG: ribose 5-phosphate isomerase B [Bacteroidetes bacterium GWF2_29_10]|nr:MAG: ribose 5-phosphate isomerase B [Bacteroidetes bacterium GWF2_29_10]